MTAWEHFARMLRKRAAEIRENTGLDCETRASTMEEIAGMAEAAFRKSVAERST